jgi:hypothetical protein
VDRGDGVDIQSAVCSELGVKLLGPECFDSPSGEGATEEGPVGFDEAEHSVDGNGVVEVFADYRDLLVDAVDEGGAVAGPYEELLYSGVGVLLRL